LTCTQLTRLYLDRIAAYDMKGPALHAIITVNPKALKSADFLRRTGVRFAGKCFSCVAPVV
jgi:amidase